MTLADMERLQVQSKQMLLTMKDNGLTRICFDVHTDTDCINAEGFALSGFMLQYAYEWGWDIRAGFWRGERKSHGTQKEYEGHAPIDGQTLYL